MSICGACGTKGRESASFCCECGTSLYVIEKTRSIYTNKSYRNELMARMGAGLRVMTVPDHIINDPDSIDRIHAAINKGLASGMQQATINMLRMSSY